MIEGKVEMLSYHASHFIDIVNRSEDYDINKVHLESFYDLLKVFKEASINRYGSFDDAPGIKYTIERIDYIVHRYRDFLEKRSNPDKIEASVLSYALRHLLEELKIFSAEMKETD